MPSIDAASRRLGGLDAVRGVAAILVALRHIPFLAPDIFPESFLAVDLFFVMSGVVLCGAYEGRLRNGLTQRSYMALRLIRLYPLYLLGSALGLLAVFMAPGSVSEPIALLVVFALVMWPDGSADLFPLDSPSWSLLLELIASLAYGTMARRGSASLLLAVIASCGLGLATLCLARPDHSLDLGWTLGSLPGGLLRVGFSFAMGVWLRHLSDKVGASARGAAAQTAITWAILAIIVLILTARPSQPIRPYFECASILWAFPLLVVLMARQQPAGRSLGLFAMLGSLSYPLYVLHAPAAQLVEITRGRNYA